MNNPEVLALTAAIYEVMGYANYRDRAVDTLVWAKTEGLAEVLRREREYLEAKKVERPFTGTAESGEGCPLNTGAGHVCGCPGDHVEFRPPTYEEEHITSPSGLPK